MTVVQKHHSHEMPLLVLLVIIALTIPLGTSHLLSGYRFHRILSDYYNHLLTEEPLDPFYMANNLDFLEGS